MQTGLYTCGFGFQAFGCQTGRAELRVGVCEWVNLCEIMAEQHEAQTKGCLVPASGDPKGPIMGPPSKF